jgi:O-Antigen ligase
MYLLINKPEIVAVVFFTMVISKINFDLKGLPLNSKAIMSLAMFFRVLMDKKAIKFSTFLANPTTKLLIIFLTYVIFIALSQNLFTMDLLKESISSILAAFFVYHYFLKLHNNNQLKYAMIASGLICFADLVYTYVVFGGFPMHRLSDNYASNEYGTDYVEDIEGPNWNFFGQTCGMCFVFMLSDLIKYKSEKKIAFLLLPIMLLGVLMSTSRSALLGLLVVVILIILNGINYREQKKRITKIAIFIVGTALTGILLFAIFGKFLNLNSRFIDEMISRMSDEPVAIIKKSLGQQYNINNLGSMYWREESSEIAYSAFMNLDLREQLFGIGNTGFEARSLGHGFNAHNATLLLLIENGLIGFFLFFLLVGGTIIQSLRMRNFSPSVSVVLFTIVYGLGQNREWTSITTYIFLFGIVSEIQFLRMGYHLQAAKEIQNSGSPELKEGEKI